RVAVQPARERYHAAGWQPARSFGVTGNGPAPWVSCTRGDGKGAYARHPVAPPVAGGGDLRHGGRGSGGFFVRAVERESRAAVRECDDAGTGAGAARGVVASGGASRRRRARGCGLTR